MNWSANNVGRQQESPAFRHGECQFLNQNNALYKNGKERINNDALATLTILVASSRPEDKEIMIQLIKTIIK